METDLILNFLLLHLVSCTQTRDSVHGNGLAPDDRSAVSPTTLSVTCSTPITPA